MSITDHAFVQQQYADEGNLETRRAIWWPDADGRDPATEALAAIVAAHPHSILEVGCGTGAFAARIQAALPDAALVATDQSERFVVLTRERGVRAKHADVESLPLTDDSVDVVAAMWMLYHVADLDRGLAEIARVLRPGGLLVAATNGDRHLADLREAAGGAALLTEFSRENGADRLAPHFVDIARQDFATRAVFADHAQAMAYLASSHEDVAWDLPWFDASREFAGASSVFTARKAPRQAITSG